MNECEQFDVAIVGGGPAGLSAAIVLGRCQRKVILFDDGKPRNEAATSVNGYLGLNAVTPAALRDLGRQQALAYSVQFVDAKVTEARRSAVITDGFTVEVADRITVESRKLLLATGVRDVLPSIANLDRYYGKSVHHCPYCDGWEHRGKRLIALGTGDSVVELALLLLGWSTHVTVCSSGERLSVEQQSRLAGAHIAYCSESIRGLSGDDEKLSEVVFDDGSSLPCDAIFFGAEQGQRSELPQSLGCECDSEGLILTKHKKKTNIPGLFLAGDADGDVQFAIVAAAEGAIAATAINRELQDEDVQCVDAGLKN